MCDHVAGGSSEDDSYVCVAICVTPLETLPKGFLAGEEQGCSFPLRWCGLRNNDPTGRDRVSTVSSFRSCDVRAYPFIQSQDLYKDLRISLIDRLTDKEPLVRAHSVAALSKLALSEDPDDLDEDGEPTLHHLLNNLLKDPAAYVCLNFCSIWLIDFPL